MKIYVVCLSNLVKSWYFCVQQLCTFLSPIYRQACHLTFLMETCNSYISILTQSTLSSAKVMKINAVYRSNLVKSCYFCVLQLCALLSPIYVILYKCWTCFDSFYLILFVPEEGKTETSCSNKQELKVFGFHNTVHLYR